MFAKMDKNIFTRAHNVDTTSAAQEIDRLDTYESIQSIVQKERDDGFPRLKRTFKVKPPTSADSNGTDHRDNRVIMQPYQPDVKYKFISIRVKPQPYLGK